MSDPATKSAPTVPPILYLGSDPGLPERLRPPLDKQGLVLEVAADLGALRARLAGGHGEGPGAGDGQRSPTLVALLLDTAALGPQQSVGDVRSLLNAAGHGKVPLVVLAPTRDIAQRLAALRAGAAAFFVAPAGTTELAERLVALARPAVQSLGRVLVVDDEATEIALVERILTRAGFTVHCVADALQVLEALNDFHPDLVLMDLHMPGADGAELTAIIRQEEAFASTPILFLSGERDPERQVAALSMGADAFITKPIRPDLLVAAVQQRLGISRTLRQRLRRSEHFDAVTGLATRRYFISRLERAIAAAGDGDAGTGLLLVKLDAASLIDARIGTAGSELVRERIGQRLATWLETSDLATRLDHQCYALWLQRADGTALVKAADGLRLAVSVPPMRLGGQSLQITISIGIAPLHAGAGDAVTLISQAEKACAEAQSAGGNRCVLYQRAGEGRARAAIAALLERALQGDARQGGFRLFYQPVASLAGEEPHLTEVALKLLAGDLDLLPEQDLLADVAHRARLHEIDRWLVREAIGALASQAEAQPDLALVVPQHLDTLASDGWILWFRDLLVAAGLTRKRLIIGLPVTDLQQRAESGAILLRMLAKLGIKTCLFGVDDSFVALDLVAELRPPLVKLTQAVGRAADTDALHQLIGRLHQYGAEVIVGGMDDPRRLAIVSASGADYLQGALIHESTPELAFDWDDVAMTALDEPGAEESGEGLLAFSTEGYLQ